VKPHSGSGNKEDLRRRISGSWDTVHLTRMSVIQGVAFGLLIFNTFEYVQKYAAAYAWLRFLPYSVLSFIMLVLVTYEYTRFVGFFPYPQRVWDIMTPYFVGIAEAGCFFYLTNPRSWWFLTGVFCCLGSWSFHNTMRDCSQFIKRGQNVNQYRLIQNYFRVNIYLTIMVALICALTVLLSMRGLHWYVEVPACMVSGACGLSLIYKGEKVCTKLYRELGLEQYEN